MISSDYWIIESISPKNKRDLDCMAIWYQWRLSFPNPGMINFPSQGRINSPVRHQGLITRVSFMLTEEEYLMLHDMAQEQEWTQGKVNLSTLSRQTVIDRKFLLRIKRLGEKIYNFSSSHIPVSMSTSYDSSKPSVRSIIFSASWYPVSFNINGSVLG